MNAREFTSRSHKAVGSILFLFLCSFALAQSVSLLPAAAQTSASSAKPSDAPNARTVLISVRNKDGSPADVSPSEIKLKLDGKDAIVSAAKRASDVPLYYWLLVDSSGSERLFLKEERDEAAALLSKVVQSGRDYGTLVAFDQQAYLDAEGTDPQVLLKAMAGEIARGSTAFYDALFSAADRVTDVRKDLRVMFIFSDGGDNNSHVSRDEAMRALLREKIRVYTFGHADSDQQYEMSSGKRGAENLRQFAETTGGRAYFPKKDSDFEKALADISGELQSLVSVTFTPSSLKSGSPLHKFEVTSKKHGVSVSAPQEYYLPD